MIRPAHDLSSTYMPLAPLGCLRIFETGPFAADWGGRG